MRKSRVFKRELKKCNVKTPVECSVGFCKSQPGCTRVCTTITKVVGFGAQSTVLLCLG